MTVGAAVGVGEDVGLGVAAGVAVDVGVGEGVDVGTTVAVAEAVAVGVLVAVAVAVAVAVGVAIGVPVGVELGVGVAIGPALTAAKASTRPKPKELFGIWVEGIPPQVWPLTVTPGLAVFCKIVLVASMSRTNPGRADQSSATTPTTCGPAIDVPLMLPKLLSLPRVVERTLTPGAETFGFMRFGV